MSGDPFLPHVEAMAAFGYRLVTVGDRPRFRNVSGTVEIHHSPRLNGEVVAPDRARCWAALNLATGAYLNKSGGQSQVRNKFARPDLAAKAVADIWGTP